MDSSTMPSIIKPLSPLEPQPAKPATPARNFALWSAGIEASLSTHAFELLFLAFYVSATALMFTLGFRTQWVNTPTPNLSYYISIARGAGYALNLNTSLVILIAARLTFTLIRETPLQHLLPLDKAFPAFHMIVGYVTAALVLVHGSFHMTWIIAYNGWSSGIFGFTMSFATGWILLIVFSAMLITARPAVRKKHFRLFYNTHLIGAALFFLVLIFHGMYNTVPETYKWIAPSLAIYILDRIVRRVKVSSNDLEISLEQSVLKEGDIFELRVPKPFDYRPGHYAEVMVPSINREWHPFSIASAPHESTMCFYIKVLGDWTRAFRDAFKAHLEGDDTTPLKVRIRGPYGAPCQDVDGFKRVVLISGGVGATPFSAICKELHYLKSQVDDDESSSGSYSSDVDDRIRASIANHYDVDVKELQHANSLQQQKSIFVANMLELTAPKNPSTLTRMRTSALNQAEMSPGQATITRAPTALHRMTSIFGSLNLPGPAYPDRNADLEAKGSGPRVTIVEPTESADSHSPALQHKLSSFGKKATFRHMVSTFKEPEELVTWDDVIDEPVAPEKARQKIAQLFDKRAMLLAFFHSSRVTFFLLITVLARIVTICMGSIFDSIYFQLSNDVEGYDEIWISILDTVLSFFVSISLPLTLYLELSFMKRRFFNSTARCFDFCLFLPATIIYTAVGIQTWTQGSPQSSLVKVITYVVITPLIFLMLMSRLDRTIRSRSLLSDPPCVSDEADTIPDVDFIWSFPYETSDKWLRDELGPLAEGTELRLHRYVTRAKELEEESQSFIKAKTGRPDWDEIFQNVAEETNSNGAVGVFFCGPHVMGNQIRAAMRKVEVLTNLRAAYLRNTPEKVLVSDLNLPGAEAVERLRARGCNVHFVYREENFG